MKIRAGLHRLKYCLLFGTWPYLPAHFYYFKKLKISLIEENHFEASSYHRKFREADQLIRYGQKLSLPQLEIVKALEKTNSPKVSIEALITGRFWRYQDGSLNFKPKIELLLTALYILLFILSTIFFVGSTFDLISLEAPLWFKALLILSNAASISTILFLLGFYSVLPLFHFMRNKDKIEQIEEARKIEADEHSSKKAKISHLLN